MRNFWKTKRYIILKFFLENFISYIHLYILAFTSSIISLRLTLFHRNDSSLGIWSSTLNTYKIIRQYTSINRRNFSKVRDSLYKISILKHCIIKLHRNIQINAEKKRSKNIRASRLFLRVLKLQKEKLQRN